MPLYKTNATPFKEREFACAVCERMFTTSYTNKPTTVCGNECRREKNRRNARRSAQVRVRRQAQGKWVRTRHPVHLAYSDERTECGRPITPGVLAFRGALEELRDAPCKQCAASRRKVPR